ISKSVSSNDSSTGTDPSQSWNLERFRRRSSLANNSSDHKFVDDAQQTQLTQQKQSQQSQPHGIDLYGEDVMSGILEDLGTLSNSRHTDSTNSHSTLMTSSGLSKAERNVFRTLHGQLSSAIAALTHSSADAAVYEMPES